MPMVINLITRLQRARYINMTDKAIAANPRCLTDWCDYCDTNITYIAAINDTKIGQSCRKHYGALIRDLAGTVYFIPKITVHSR